MDRALNRTGNGAHLRRGSNLIAIALIAAGISLIVDSALKAWSDHSPATSKSSANAPVWLPHMPRKSELIRRQSPDERLDTRFKPYTSPGVITPGFQPAVGIHEAVNLRRRNVTPQTHIAGFTSARESKTDELDTVSRAMDSGVWNIKGFPEALIRVQQYSAN